MTLDDECGGGTAGQCQSARVALLSLPEGIISIDPAVLDAHSGDAVVRQGERIAAVAFPRSTEEVVLLLRTCREHGIPVAAQGGLTGYSGGATPEPGGLALSLARMNAIGPVDRDGATITVGAGAILQSVQTAAEAAGLMVPVDLGARGSCTIGGMIATNAGGNRVLRYGMTREMVLGLECVLADGTVIDATGTMLKNNTGYDLKQLFIGSEGTLGIITRAVLRLVPRPTSMCAALCGIPDYDAAMRLLHHARAALGTELSAFEVMWPDFYAVATAHGRAPLQGRHGLYVLLDTLGTDQERDQESFEAAIVGALEGGLIEDAVIAQSVAQAEALWAVREATGEFNRMIGPRVPFDISIPTARIGAFADICRERFHARWPGARSLFFGHVADSNLHITVALENGATVEGIKDLVYALVGEWGGSVSAEHGIGKVKRQYLHLSRTTAELDLMHVLKGALDPTGVLNPGKVLS